MGYSPIKPRKPLLRQLDRAEVELDQLLSTAPNITASNPDLSPEDVGFPDSYLTLALYRLNTVLSRSVDLDESKYNIFHEYHRAPKCEPAEVKPGRRLASVLNRAINLAGGKKTIGVGHFLRSVVELTLDEPPGE